VIKIGRVGRKRRPQRTGKKLRRKRKNLVVKRQNPKKVLNSF
jgi:hypothetical protein